MNTFTSPITPYRERLSEMGRILVADDQPDVRAALRLLFKNEGFAIETAESPESVIQAVRENDDFDLLLLDLNYARDTTSGVEGLELLSRVRGLDKEVPILLMTAWSSVDLAVQAMRSGGWDFIQKPWNNRELLRAAGDHIREGRLLRERVRREASAARFVDQLEDARRIQERLLPAHLSRPLPGCEIQAAWQPAGDVGGDYFDVIRLGRNRLAFCIGDVEGKGLAAALLMSNIQAAVRAFSSDTLSPAELCARLNRVVKANTGGRKFVTFFYGVLDTRERTLCYSNAGHLPPVLVRSDGSSVRLREGGALLGIFPDPTYDLHEVGLGDGDRIVLMTDGITEAMNENLEEFGEERVIGLVRAGRHLQASELQEQLLGEVVAFSGGGLDDDAALMMLSIGSTAESR